MKYYGGNSLKQFIKNKPIRFGLMNWGICWQSGYCYHVKLCCGKDGDQNSNVPLGTRVVHDLIDCVQPTISNAWVLHKKLGGKNGSAYLQKQHRIILSKTWFSIMIHTFVQMIFSDLSLKFELNAKNYFSKNARNKPVLPL